MKYDNIKWVRRQIYLSIALAVVIILINSGVSHILLEIRRILRWITWIAVGLACCNIWATFVGYRVSMYYKSKGRSAENNVHSLVKVKKTDEHR